MFQKCGILLMLVGIFLSEVVLFAAPARPAPIDYRLPDGSEITITLKGDERVHWAQTPDGYTLLFNKDGYLEYAVADGSGGIKPSGVQAHNAPGRSTNERNFLSKQPKDLRYGKVQVNSMLQLRNLRQTFHNELYTQEQSPENQQKISGLVRAPIILVGFQDKTFGKTKTDFEMLMNQPDYVLNADGEEITGSVHDYFLASSRGLVNFQVDVYGPYKLTDSIIYYDESSGNDGSRLGREAAAAASADGLNFADYDLNEDGFVDCMHIIFAGHGQESGATEGESIWAHMGEFETPLNYNGKKIKNYSCSPELRNNSGDSITHIGVIAHELSHVFGLPDFYDADYSLSGTAVDMGEWCIMAHGNWNDDGRTPALHSAWARNFLGWVSTIELTENDRGIQSMPNPADSALVYRINTTTEKEYFLLENRQKQGWDSFIPGNGMLICHVDENWSGWRNNGVNNNVAHRGYYVKQAGCDKLASNCSKNRETDPYPQPNNTSFTDESVPYSMSWARNPTEKPITGITHDTILKTISFYFIDEAPVSIQDLQKTKYQSLKAWMQDGVLHIDGLTIGQRWCVYNSIGVLIYQDIAGAVAETWQTNIPRGVYIIQSGNKSVKFIKQ
ncbi:MAG: M6 family metalloprotease domain-containing protein [Bacteroidales bacterium]|jgi:M6 family metalloprotease-like protein|nr:M6 family metalloprotease domain-containing protein [Bacteroidales bacterium]